MRFQMINSVASLQFSFTSFAPGEPDPGGQDCLQMSDSDNWDWANELNSVQQFYLCQQD